MQSRPPPGTAGRESVRTLTVMRDPAVEEDRRAAARRIRWRLRGAWMWPAFAVLTVIDTVLLRVLPLSGDDGTDPVPAFLLAGSLNVVAIAVGGALGGWVLRRRRPDLPKVVADDYAGTAAVLAVTLVFLVVGLAQVPGRRAHRADVAAQAAAARAYVDAQAPAYRDGLSAADTLQIDEELYRTCIPGPGRDRPLCLYIDTSGRPATPRRDPSSASNAQLAPYGAFR
jgi:hypothetical protein